MSRLELVADETLDGDGLFLTTKHVSVQKEDIWNYGVFHYEVPPERIGENAFEHLQSKIPHYYGLYDEQIDFAQDAQTITCKVGGEAATTVTEIVGVGVGLKAASEVFGFSKRDIAKIPPSSKKAKRLDFRVSCNGTPIEIETRATAYQRNVSQMIREVRDKKSGKAPDIRRFGFLTLLRKPGDSGCSRIHVTDPLVPDEGEPLAGVYGHINYYLLYLSFILDNPRYNRIVRNLKNGTRYRKPILKEEWFKYTFEYGNTTYWGQCFDKRLILHFIQRFARYAKNADALFDALTQNIGLEKFFLGIDSQIIRSINKKDLTSLTTYSSSDRYETLGGQQYMQMSDGVLFIRSRDGSLPEMEEKFPESDVRARLFEFNDYLSGAGHECGAPCRSREIEGKPCEIKTYREHCHFHR